MLAVVKRVNVYKTELPKHLYFSLRNWGEVKFEGSEMKVDHAGKEPKNSFLHADKKKCLPPYISEQGGQYEREE